MRVTFDSNTLDRAVRPERFPKDQRQSDFQKIQHALKSGTLQGFFSETLITLEAVMRADRAKVFGGTRLEQTIKEGVLPDRNIAVAINLTTRQPDRKGLPTEVAARVQAAFALGLRLLRAPRIAFIRIDDPTGHLFASDKDEAELSTRLDRYHAALRDFEQKGLGIAQAKALGAKFAHRDGVAEAWFESLKRATDVHERNAVARAVAEWADADSIASHIGYGIEFFCTEDVGKGSATPSILDATNRPWLEKTYGVRFVTLTELANFL